MNSCKLLKSCKVSCVNTRQHLALQCRTTKEKISSPRLYLCWYDFGGEFCCREGMFQGAPLCVHPHCKGSSTPRCAVERNPITYTGRLHSLVSCALSIKGHCWGIALHCGFSHIPLRSVEVWFSIWARDICPCCGSSTVWMNFNFCLLSPCWHSFVMNSGCHSVSFSLHSRAWIAQGAWMQKTAEDCWYWSKVSSFFIQNCICITSYTFHRLYISG